MDIHVDICGFLEIHEWVCYGFSDHGGINSFYDYKTAPMRDEYERRLCGCFCQLLNGAVTSRPPAAPCLCGGLFVVFIPAHRTRQVMARHLHMAASLPSVFLVSYGTTDQNLLLWTINIGHSHKLPSLLKYFVTEAISPLV